jgi:aryl-alcohol dehydrogenase-like predicted oxidoreductase
MAAAAVSSRSFSRPPFLNKPTKSRHTHICVTHPVPKFQGENFYKNRAIVSEMRKLAAKKGCTTTQVALAWVAAQGFIAIPGTTKAHRLEENWASRDVELTEAEMAEVRRIVEEAKPQGDRYGESLQKLSGH